MNSFPISSIMTETVLTLNPHQKLDEIQALFKSSNIRHAPVVKGGKLVGIISSSDLDQLSSVSQLSGSDNITSLFSVTRVKDVMNTNVVTIQKDDSIKDAALIFARKSINALPVLHNDQLVGIVTTTDLILFLADLL